MELSKKLEDKRNPEVEEEVKKNWEELGRIRKNWEELVSKMRPVEENRGIGNGLTRSDSIKEGKDRHFFSCIYYTLWFMETYEDANESMVRPRFLVDLSLLQYAIEKKN